MAQTVLLKDVVQINPTTSLKKGEIVKFVSMDKLEPYKRKISSYNIKNFSGGMKFKNKDILLARITPCLENGKTAQVDFLDEDEVGAGSTEYVVLRAKDGVTDANFVYYLSISPDFRRHAIKSMIGTSGRQRIQNEMLAQMRFELPTLVTQQKIGNILGAIDEKIELNMRMNETLEQMGQALFRHYFITNPAAENWEEESLDEVTDFLNGLAMQKYPKVQGQPTLPVIKIREMSSGITPNTDIASSAIPEKYIISNGDLLFSWSGTLLVKFWSEGKGALNQHLFKVTSSGYPEWFYYHWINYHLADFIRTAKSKATTMGHIQRKHLHQAKVRVPGKTLLLEIGTQIQPLIDQIKRNDQEIQTLTTLRNTLLPRLISGKLKL